MRKKVIFVTSSRSEYYLIKPLLLKCKKTKEIDLKSMEVQSKIFGNA